MGRVNTNDMTLSAGIQAAQGSDPTVWRTLEPNSIGDFGATVTNTSRSPISKDKQLRKGVPTDLDSAAGFDSDSTLTSIDFFAESFLFSTASNRDLNTIGGAATATGYTVPTQAAGTLAKLAFVATGAKSLMFGRGYADSANNGLKTLSAAAITTEIKFAGLVAEATPPKNAEIEIAGIRAKVGDLALTVTAAVAGISPATAVLSNNNNGVVDADEVKFLALGLEIGQFIHIGGLNAAEQFATVGFGRVSAITADDITLDKLDPVLATDTGAAKTVDILFGRFNKNVPVGTVSTTGGSVFSENFIMLELAFPNLDPGGAIMFQYSKDNLANTWVTNMPLSSKSTSTFSLVGTDTDDPTLTQKIAFVNHIAASKSAAISTAAKGMRLQATDIIEEAVSTDFKNITLTINNGVTAEKILGQQAAKFVNTGNFEVTLQSQMLFTNADIIAAIRGNDTMTMDWKLANGDGALYVDIPNMTFGGGNREFPLNETVLVNITGTAFGDPTSKFTYSLGLSQFPTVP